MTLIGSDCPLKKVIHVHVLRWPRQYGEVWWPREVWWPISIVKGDLGVARRAFRPVAVRKLH